MSKKNSHPVTQAPAVQPADAELDQTTAAVETAPVEDTAQNAPVVDEAVAETAQVPTPEPTPAPTEAPTITIGYPATETLTVVPTAMTMGTVAPPLPVLDISSLLREKSKFEQGIDTIIESGSITLRTIAAILRDYEAAMGTSTLLDAATINAQQGALWRAIRMAINSADDFEPALQLIISYMRRGKDDAFSDVNVFRGFEHTKLNPVQSKAFQSLLTLLKVAVSVNSLSQVRKAVDLGRAMTSPAFTPEARTRVLGFFA